MHTDMYYASIDISDLVSSLPSDEQTDSTGDTAQQQIEPSKSFGNEQPTPCDVLPTPPESSCGDSHSQGTTEPSTKRRKVVGGLRPVYSSSRCKRSAINAVEEVSPFLRIHG